MENKRNILLCVAGATPQIITETLYDLTIQKGQRIDEIRVITTLDGRDKIMTGIIKGRGGSAEESLLDNEKGQFFNFLQHYPQVGNIEFNETKILLLRRRDGQTLEDIRTPEENELAGDQICEFVRELCKKEENKRIFASAAGGRKTMSIYLTLAMSLFGRAEDSLSHVLVSADFEMNKHFFYPPPTPKMIDVFNPITKETRQVSTANAEIFLAPIPFLRLRGISSDNEKFGKARNYCEMVTEAQKVLDIKEKEYDLNISLKNNCVFVRGQKVEFTPREFFFYVMFIKRNLIVNENVSLKSLRFEDFDETFSEIMKARGKDVGWEQRPNIKGYSFAETMLQQLESNRPKDFDDFRSEFSKVVTLIGNKFKAKGVDNRYYLVSTDDGTASYKLGIGQERIKFVE